MKNGTKLIALAVALVVVISAVALIAAQGPVTTGAADQGNKNPNPNPNPGTTPSAGGNNNANTISDPTTLPVTTITASKTATGYWDQTNKYSWTVDKDIYPTDKVLAAPNEDGYNVMIHPGESVMVTYNLTADRCGPVVTDVFGVMGGVTVTNTGCNDTQGLTIWDTVQTMASDCSWTDLKTVQVDTTCHPVLKAGESYTYGYNITFDPIEGVCYRNVANVTITNFVDHVDAPYGVQACQEFSLPDSPQVTTIDDEAILSDAFTVPDGFTAKLLTAGGPWNVGGCDGNHFAANVVINVTNVNAERNMTFVLCNQAVLTLPCGKLLNSTVPLTIFTGPLETTLTVSKTAEVKWTESMELGINMPSDVVNCVVNTTTSQSDDQLSPVAVTQSTVSDISTFTVCGHITVTNTGDCPTIGLMISDTVQMANSTCEWQTLAMINVDVSAMPVLMPGESYCYPYVVTFTLDNLQAQAMGELQFRNVACATICDGTDGQSMGVSYYLPLVMPLKPCVLTVETQATFDDDNVVPLCHAGQDAQLEFVSHIAYEQMVVVRYGDDQTSVDTWTNVTAHTTVTHSTLAESVSKCLDTAIYHAESTVIKGSDNKAVLQFATTTYDNKTLTIMVDGYNVDMSLSAALYVNDCLGVQSSDCGYMLGNQEMMAYGVFASFEYPQDADFDD